MRVFVARSFIAFGMWLLPADVRKLVRNIMLYHVPGALTNAEKADVEASKAAWKGKR